MKQQFEKQGNRPDWESMSTQELEDLLDQDFAADLDGFLATDDILAMTEVINDRAEETLAGADVQASWEDFRARIRKEQIFSEVSNPNGVSTDPDATTFDTRKRAFGRKKLRWAVVVAAVVCLLVSMMMVTVSGERGADRVIRWTDQHFFFGSQGGLPQEHLGGVTYDELREIVEGLTVQPVLPNWYPEGSVLEKIKMTEMIDRTNVNISFALDGREFYQVIKVYHSEPIGTAQYEKNEGPVKTYLVNEIPHYILDNMERVSLVWENGNTESMIYGDLTEIELKMMVDSIYR